METQTKVLIIIGLTIAIVIGFSLSQSRDTPEAVTGTNDDALVEDSMEATDGMMVDEVEGEMADAVKEEGEEMMKDEEMSDEMMKDEPTAQAGVGAYVAYSPEAVANSEAENILLTFSATWCPSCRTLDKNITENLSSIPAGTEIYKVDYDSNVALRQQYGVTTQHTHVLIDNNGEMIKKWSGGNTLGDLVASI